MRVKREVIINEGGMEPGAGNKNGALIGGGGRQGNYCPFNPGGNIRGKGFQPE